MMDWREFIAAFFLSVLGAAIGLFVFLSVHAFGRELYPGQYSQLDPAVRKWFRNQTSPKTGGNCCSEADGTYAEEDIIGGHYWTKFSWHHFENSHMVELTTAWMQVDDDVVIHDPNRHGAPVVWWAWQSGFGADAKVQIRCYAPGGGV